MCSGIVPGPGPLRIALSEPITAPRPSEASISVISWACWASSSNGRPWYSIHCSDGDGLLGQRPQRVLAQLVGELGGDRPLDDREAVLLHLGDVAGEPLLHGPVVQVRVLDGAPPEVVVQPGHELRRRCRSGSRPRARSASLPNCWATSRRMCSAAFGAVTPTSCADVSAAW